MRTIYEYVVNRVGYYSDNLESIPQDARLIRPATPSSVKFYYGEYRKRWHLQTPLKVGEVLNLGEGEAVPNQVGKYHTVAKPYKIHQFQGELFALPVDATADAIAKAQEKISLHQGVDNVVKFGVNIIVFAPPNSQFKLVPTIDYLKPISAREVPQLLPDLPEGTYIEEIPRLSHEREIHIHIGDIQLAEAWWQLVTSNPVPYQLHWLKPGEIRFWGARGNGEILEGVNYE